MRDAPEHHLGYTAAVIPNAQIDAKIKPMSGFRQGSATAAGGLRVNVVARKRQNNEAAIMKWRSRFALRGVAATLKTVP